MLNRLAMPAGDARELASAVRAELVEACASVRVCKSSCMPGLAPAGDAKESYLPPGNPRPPGKPQASDHTDNIPQSWE